jgi:hypothetical protein
LIRPSVRLAFPHGILLNVGRMLHPSFQTREATGVRARVDVAVVGDGLTGALCAASLSASRLTSAWVTSADRAERQRVRTDVRLFTPLTDLMLRRRGSVLGGLRSMAIRYRPDLEEIWSQRKDVPFKLRYWSDRRTVIDTSAKALAAVARRSFDLLFSEPWLEAVRDALEHSGVCVFDAGTDPRYDSLLASAIALGPRPQEGVLAHMRGASGRDFLFQSAWRLQSEAETVAAFRLERKRLPAGANWTFSRTDEGWMVPVDDGVVVARKLVVTDAALLLRMPSRIVQRLPFGRLVGIGAHFADLHGEMAPLIDAGGAFQAHRTSRGVYVRLLPSLDFGRSMLKERLNGLAASALGQLVGEARDTQAFEEVWEAPDGLPVFGAVPGEESVWIVHTPDMLALATAPVLAKALAFELSGEAAPVLNTLFGVQRLQSRLGRLRTGPQKSTGEVRG